MSKKTRTYRVVLRPMAVEDLETIAEFIALDSPKRSEAFIERVLSAIAGLATMPSRCPIAPEQAAFDRPIRQRVVGVYRVIFTIQGDVVRVLRVRHAARRVIDPQSDVLDE